MSKEIFILLEIIKAILFGIIEGVTEWLPISSTGHMILLDEFIHLGVSAQFYKLFEVVIQLGAILAVILLYFEKIWPLKHPGPPHPGPVGKNHCSLPACRRHRYPV